MAFYAIFFQNYYFYNMYVCLSRAKSWLSPLRRFLGSSFPKKEEIIYAPHGSCIVFGRHYFEAGGTFDHPVFLFNEELFVAEMALAKGLGVMFCPSLEIWDEEHAGTGVWRSRKIFNYVIESNMYFYQRYWSEGNS
jgi:GT2 family glycosyltransferase